MISGARFIRVDLSAATTRSVRETRRRAGEFTPALHLIYTRFTPALHLLCTCAYARTQRRDLLDRRAGPGRPRVKQEQHMRKCQV